ncbi:MULTISPECIES: hypothetical protein [unclassified Bradyrhizobium]|nr:MULTISPECIES: hypothetical protein [unclassified Bradyrhizobium]
MGNKDIATSTPSSKRIFRSPSRAGARTPEAGPDVAIEAKVATINT